MRLTKKEKIKELATLKKHNVLMTDDDYKELKLGQLEDFEEELGIDLFVFIKSIIDDFIYIKEGKKIIKSDHPRLLLGSKEDGGYRFECFDSQFEDGWAEGYLEDYGKTWALTKKELK